nr:UvrD-helicase domain-containing protein [Kutzneria sp. 744]
MQLVSPQEVAAALGLPAPTDEQAAVVAASAQPALVVAGAGAGKTETMAARVVWLVANGLVTPDRVLGLTFTRKAARQLGERIRARLRRLAGSGLLDELDPGGDRRALVLATEPTVLTYHAYAGRLVGEHGLRLPVEPGARLLTGTASWQLAHRVVATWTEDLDTDKVPATITGYLLSLAGELAEHLVEPDKILRHAEWMQRIIESAPKGPRQRAEMPTALREIITAQRFRVAMLPLLEAYQLRKRKEAALDFADQMALAAQLASGFPEVAAGERERYGAVLLDEYQDTGHAQRVLLRSLFGMGDPMPVTAVGDPAQAIYGWRGASAANLPRFTTDFPLDSLVAEKRPAPKYGLLTSFATRPRCWPWPTRCPGRCVPRASTSTSCGPGPGPSRVTCTVRCCRTCAPRSPGWPTSSPRGGRRSTTPPAPPTAAVLVRRRADMGAIAHALRERGLPVEVVGLGGLLDEPEVRDLVSALRVLIEPLAGTAAARLLSGSRWRLGAADIAALWKRAGELAGRQRPSSGDDPLAAITDSLPGEHAEQAGLVDAIDDPGEPERYSEAGYKRIRRLGNELSMLRRRQDQPLPDLVADVERTLLLDIEATARPGRVGRAHLDAFADVVADYASASPSATLPSLLDYLRTAENAEDGLEPGEVEVAEDRVQILTMHAAKGLEWEIVVVPHVVRNVFPGPRKSSSWLKNVTELPADLRGDSQDLPRLNLAGASNRKEVEEAIAIHNEEFEERRLVEERRLCYVALTRSERVLLVSGHWWGETGEKPRGPSDFLDEVHAVLSTGDRPPGMVDEWAPAPAEDESNPLVADVRTARWPVDPLASRREAVAEGATMVLAALADLADAEREAAKAPHTESLADEEIPPVQEHSAEPWDEEIPPPEEEDWWEEEVPLDTEDPEGWAADVDVLLAEREAARSRRELVALPDQLTVSQLVELAEDPDALARRLRRPLPFPPNPLARRGTAFHSWLEQRFKSNRLFDLDELPGAADDVIGQETDADLARLREAFLSSQWADRVPADVEVAFETEVDGVAVRGRMDAVYADPDGGWTVVDWKTGAVPTEDKLPALSVQLAAYRLAWAALQNAPVDKVRAAFHYVRHDHTLSPADLLDADGLKLLLSTVPRA